MDTITANKDAMSLKFVTQERPPRGVLKIASVLVASAFALSATNVQANDWEVEPSLTVSSTYSDNIDLTPNGESEFVTEVSPAVSISREGRRLSVNLDYSLQNLLYIDDSGRNASNHRLGANANAEVLLDTLFVDFSSSFGQQQTDRRSSSSSDAISGEDNLSDVYSYSMSPYWQQRLGDVADYELRYTYDMVNSGDTSSSSQDSNSEGNAVAFDIESGPATGKINWGLDYANSQVDYDSGAKSDTESGSASVGYQLTSSFNTFVSGSFENNEFSGGRGEVEPDDSSVGAGFVWAPTQDLNLTLAYNERLDPLPNEDDTFVSGNIFWAPTARTDLNLALGNGFFGETLSGSLAHRTRWTRWNFSYDEGASDFRSLVLEQGRIVCPRNALATATSFATLIAQCRTLAPGETRQPDEGFLRSRNNGAFFSGINASITEDTFISKTGRASVSIVGARNTITLAASNTRRKFVADNRTEENASLDLSWVYELTPLTDSLMTIGQTKEKFDDGEEDDFMRYLWRVTRQIGSSSIFYVEAQINERDSATSSRSYDENRLTVSFEKFF